MDQETIHELMRADLEAAGFDFDKHLESPRTIHIKRKTLSRPKWTCMVCGKAYCYKGALENHIYANHKGRHGNKWREVLKLIEKIEDRQNA